MPRSPGKTMRTRAKSRAKRHGANAKGMYGTRGRKPRRWIAHQLAGDKGYRNALP